MWHSAQYRGDELIVLGHDPRRNDCMLVRLSGLPMNEQHDIRRIAASRSAQESTHLIPILRRVTAPDGSDWFTYLASKMQQRNSPVFTLPIKEIQDSLDIDQKAIFKGYGKGRRNTSLDRDDMARAQSGSDIDELDEEMPEIRGRASADTPVNNSFDYKLDLLIETVSDESHRTQELLSRLLKALAAPEEPKRAKPRRAKTTRSKAVEHSEPEVAQSI